jgi:hypothetical protein
MTEGGRDAVRRVDATVQTEEGLVIVDQQAQTNGNLMQDNSRGVWDRVRLILAACSYVFTFILGAYIWQTILAKLPNFRRYMFDEQSEITVVTETEQRVLWTFVFVPSTSLFLTICMHIFKGVRSVPWLWRKIAEFTSAYWIYKQIREQVVKRAIMPVLKKWAVQFAKKCWVVMASIACVMLMIIGLHLVLEHYNFAFHLKAFVSHLRGAIPCV